MRRTKEEILNMIRGVTGDDTADAVLELIEDVTDTIDELAADAADQTEWRVKYDELDKTWRKKYRDRFYSGDDAEGINAGTDEDDPADDKPAPTTYESLFKGDED